MSLMMAILRCFIVIEMLDTASTVATSYSTSSIFSRRINYAVRSKIYISISRAHREIRALRINRRASRL